MSVHTQKHYQGKDSLYKFAEEWGLNAYEFDIFTISQADMHCLAHAIYYEARGERYVGMLAVANVIMNRVSDPDYPKTVCEVTRQRTRTTCQFEYYCKVGNRIPRYDDPASGSVLYPSVESTNLASFNFS